MFNRHRLLRLIVFLFILMIGNSFMEKQNDQLQGAWMLDDGSGQQVLIFIDGYLTQTDYAHAAKTFKQTRGGVYKADGSKINLKVEFNSAQKEEVGKTADYQFAFDQDKLTLEMNGKKLSFRRIDNGTGALAGNWKIHSRMQDGALTPIHLSGGRKTIKILSGKRFQWAAINTDNGEFSGTGGGTYTFENGKYTEHIEFFSRDASRVGASLSFDGSVENGDWVHKGLSSRGDKIHEVWARDKN